MDLRHRYFSVKMCVQMKELGPVLGHVPGTPPRSANVFFQVLISPLIYGVERQNLNFLSYNNVFKFSVKYPMY